MFAGTLQGTHSPRSSEALPGVQSMHSHCIFSGLVAEARAPSREAHAQLPYTRVGSHMRLEVARFRRAIQRQHRACRRPS